MPVYEPLDLVFYDVFSESRAAHIETQWRLARERTRPLGGIPDVGTTSDDWADVPGVIVVRIDEPCTAQIHAMGFVSGGTGSLRLWSIDDAGAVADSSVSFTDESPTLQVSGDLELAAGDYKLQVKISSSDEHAVVYGASLVTQ